MALMQFLVVNEGDRTLDGMIGEFLPQEVFAHDFTWRFVEAWRTNVASGEDSGAAFAEGLSGREREWHDAVLLGAGKTGSSGLSATDIMQDFVRAEWEAYLKRARGSLPASGNAEADLMRVRLSMALKQFRQARWARVKDMIRDFRQH